MTVKNYTCLCDAKARPFTRDESDMFVRMLFASKENEGVMAEDITQQLKKSMSFAIMENRIGVRVDPYLLAFLSTLCATPGKSVMWAYTLSFISAQADQKVDFDLWTTYFPMGIPIEEEYERVWDLQKEAGAPLGNNLDDPNFWPEHKDL